MENVLKKDVTIALNVWKNLLLEFFQDDIEYIYAKGSSTKPWESQIDYVPQISDVDIHIKLFESNSSSLLHPNLETSLSLITEYEKRFLFQNRSLNRKYIHLPRVQIVILNKITIDLINFTYPRIQDVKILYGNPIFPQEVEHDLVRKQDKEELLKLRETLQTIPESLRDRSGKYELYIVLRRMNFLVSPTPVRLLTQALMEENPYDIWTWNRTKITRELEELNFHSIATNYEKYYVIGRELFNEDFNNNEKFLSLISTGLKVLELAYNEISSGLKDQ